MMYIYITLIIFWLFMAYFTYNDYNGPEREWWSELGIWYLKIIILCAAGLTILFMINQLNCQFIFLLYYYIIFKR